MLNDYKIIFIIVILFNIIIYYKLNKIEKLLLSIDMNKKIPIDILLNTDKIIWSYWHSEYIPLVVNIAYNSWHKCNSDYIICHINNNNLFYYINENEFPSNFNNKIIQHKADIIRLILLEKYGGIWLDSSIFLKKPLSLKWDPKNYDLGGYAFSGDNVNNLIFENWFISAPKKSPLIIEWKKEFLYATSFNDSNDYINKIENEGVNLNNIPNSKTYLLQHSCFVKITQYKKYNIKFFSVDIPFMYQIKNNWNYYLTVYDLIKKEKNKDIDLIKLRGLERDILNIFILFKENDSVIDKIIKNLK